jgi:DHA2 family multidrug resistance protein
MSTHEGAGKGLATTATEAANPWLIAIVVALAAFMEVLDTTIANVSLNYIAGGLGVSEDEASWVVTTYLVANAIIVTATSYLANRFGRKTFFLVCLGLFTVSSVLCGMAWNLQALLLFRVLQGFGGGGMVPVAQSILADSFPPAKRGQAFALFGVAVVVAPAVGPTLGGWLSDNVSWQSCFLINGPVGALSMVLVYMLVKEARPGRGVRFDWGGFILVAAFLGALEFILDRGQQDDWFGSNFIITCACISGLAVLAGAGPVEAGLRPPSERSSRSASVRAGEALPLRQRIRPCIPTVPDSRRVRPTIPELTRPFPPPEGKAR